MPMIGCIHVLVHLVYNKYLYANDQLSTTNHNNFPYNFGYDVLGNMTDVSVGSQSLVHNCNTLLFRDLLEIRLESPPFFVEKGGLSGIFLIAFL